jgi:bifunctional UDP-N-acetylglucosamine pyrophosphorylase/glucosamine-1-phosphate N-acetyltransferase
VLAAGQGKRMRSAVPKVLHKVGGLPMVNHVCDALRAVPADRVMVVLSPQAPEVREALPPDVLVVWQDEPLGTGDAARRALPEIAVDDVVLIVCADTPLLRPATLQELVRRHQIALAAEPTVGISLLSAVVDDPTGYGRIIRDDAGRVVAIVEQGDLKGEQLSLREVNAGIYCLTGCVLHRYLHRLQPGNSQGEYLLTDVVQLAIADGNTVEAITAPEAEVIGVNSRDRLAVAEAIHRRRKLDDLMAAGVTVVDPAATYVDAGVKVGFDTILWPQTFILGECSIGEGCQIGPGAHLVSTRIGDRVRVQYSTVEMSEVGDDCVIGPYAHLRPNTRLGAQVAVGNYAELKNTSVGQGTKIHHHSYLGDAEVGVGVNIGAGVVTVNYDGNSKHPTSIGDGAFIGCNANLVAPIVVGKRGYVACGSSLTEDVPPGALAIARARQTVIPGWVERRFGPVKRQDGDAGNREDKDSDLRK